MLTMRTWILFQCPWEKRERTQELLKRKNQQDVETWLNMGGKANSETNDDSTLANWINGLWFCQNNSFSKSNLSLH